MRIYQIWRVHNTFFLQFVFSLKNEDYYQYMKNRDYELYSVETKQAHCCHRSADNCGLHM